MIYVQRLLKVLVPVGILYGIAWLAAVVEPRHPWLSVGILLIGGGTLWTVLWVRWWHSEGGRRFRVLRDKWNRL